MVLLGIAALFAALLVPMFAMQAIIGLIGFANVTGIMFIVAVALIVLTWSCRTIRELDRKLEDEESGPVLIFLTAAILGSAVGLLRPSTGFVWAVILAVVGFCFVALVFLGVRGEIERINSQADQQARESSPTS